MARGRPRKSLEDHIRDGTYRRDRHGPLPGETPEKPNAPQSQVGKVSGADAVSPAVTKFETSANEAILRRELEVILGDTLTGRDSHMLDALCWWWIQMRKLQSQLDLMLPTQKGYKDVLAATGAALDRVLRVAEKFGLTPVDRSRLGVGASGPVVAKVPVRPKTKMDLAGPPNKASG